MKGAPLRLEIGPRDIENGVCMFSRRDTHEKGTIALADVAEKVPALLDDIHETMFRQSSEFLRSHIVTCHNMDEFTEALDKQCFVKAMWCGCRECEDAIKAETAASARAFPSTRPPSGTLVFIAGNLRSTPWSSPKATERAISRIALSEPLP